MSRPLTDRNAIRVALLLAIDYEESLVEAYRPQFSESKAWEQEEGVILARKRIAAFKRVLVRYYGETGEKPVLVAKVVNVYDLMTGKIEDSD